jgi:hypothetical protein
VPRAVRAFDISVRWFRNRTGLLALLEIDHQGEVRSAEFTAEVILQRRVHDVQQRTVCWKAGCAAPAAVTLWAMKGMAGSEQEAGGAGRSISTCRNPDPIRKLRRDDG